MDKTLKKFPPYLIDLFTPDKIEKLIEYADLISEYNAHINLISRKDVMNIWENHISPSIVV
ncbi:MAG: class I SAM-dependent methyltransferase, partial [Calditrichia bacterium]